MTAPLASLVGSDILNDPNFLEDAIHISESEGHRDRGGNWVRGTRVTQPVQLVTAPISGKERETLPEGLREKNVRKFWLAPTVKVLSGTDGDLIEYNDVEYRIVMSQSWGAFQEIVGVVQD